MNIAKCSDLAVSSIRCMDCRVDKFYEPEIGCSIENERLVVCVDSSGT